MAYRLYDEENGLIIISRDVDFLESDKVNYNNLFFVNDMEEPEDKIICPTTYEEAINSPHADKWIEAMISEYGYLMENETWELEEAPSGRKLIKNKWVYTLKRDDAGNIIKYKARLVAKGFSQQSGIDYDETFSPVVRYSSMRLLLALDANYELNVRQLDAVTAFSNGKLDEEIWMEQPEGFEKDGNKSCKLTKAIYGLKQASRVWNDPINDVLLNMGLNRSKMDQCIYHDTSDEGI